MASDNKKSNSEDNQFYIGSVKWFNNSKGFGFLVHENGEDVFVHYSSIVSDGFRSLKEGEKVRYRVSNTNKGLSAFDVSRHESDAPLATEIVVSSNNKSESDNQINPAKFESTQEEASKNS